MRANTPLPRNVSLYVTCLCLIFLLLYFVQSCVVDYMSPVPSLDATLTPDYLIFNPPVGSLRALSLGGARVAVVSPICLLPYFR